MSIQMIWAKFWGNSFIFRGATHQCLICAGTSRILFRYLAFTDRDLFDWIRHLFDLESRIRDLPCTNRTDLQAINASQQRCNMACRSVIFRTRSKSRTVMTRPLTGSDSAALCCAGCAEGYQTAGREPWGGQTCYQRGTLTCVDHGTFTFNKQPIALNLERSVDNKSTVLCTLW